MCLCKQSLVLPVPPGVGWHRRSVSKGKPETLRSAAARFVFDWETQLGFVNVGQVLRIPTVFLTVCSPRPAVQLWGLVFWPCLGLVGLPGIARDLDVLGTFALLTAMHRG